MTQYLKEMMEFAEEKQFWRDTRGHAQLQMIFSIESETEHLVVNDLPKDQRVSAMGCISGSPFKRFYVTVPLHYEVVRG